MVLTEKETGLLKDLKDQELLCIEKYEKHSKAACSTELKNLFQSMAQTEREHLQTIGDMMNGTVKSMPASINNSNNNHCVDACYKDEESRKIDGFLCKDMLTSEKHASSLYDTSVFEFANPEARRTLNHIQAEEQQHGEQLYAYMKCNQMYC